MRFLLSFVRCPMKAFTNHWQPNSNYTDHSWLHDFAGNAIDFRNCHFITTGATIGITIPFTIIDYYFINGHRRLFISWSSHYYFTHHTHLTAYPDTTLVAGWAQSHLGLVCARGNNLEASLHFGSFEIDGMHSGHLVYRLIGDQEVPGIHSLDSLNSI